MNAVLREAIRRVRESDDFQLLDCLELLDRRKAGEKAAVATMRWCGQTLIGYGADDSAAPVEGDCPACEGDGELEAEGANGRTYCMKCPECDGDCTVPMASGGTVPRLETLKWRTLNGDRVALDIHASCVGPRWRDYFDAQGIVDEASAVLAPAEEAAA